MYGNPIGYDGIVKIGIWHLRMRNRLSDSLFPNVYNLNSKLLRQLIVLEGNRLTSHSSLVLSSFIRFKCGHT